MSTKYPHEFDSSRICDYCGKAEEVLTILGGGSPGRIECPVRKSMAEKQNSLLDKLVIRVDDTKATALVKATEKEALDSAYGV